MTNTKTSHDLTFVNCYRNHAVILACPFFTLCPDIDTWSSCSWCSLFVYYLQLLFSHRWHSQVSSTFICNCSRLIGLPNTIYSHAISLLLHVHNQTFYARVCAFCCMVLRNPSLGVRVVRFTINQTKVGIHRLYTTYDRLTAPPNTSFSHVVHDSAYHSDETYTWSRRGLIITYDLFVYCAS